MATFRMVVSDPATRRGYQKDVDQAASGLLGKTVGENVSGSPLGLEGYTIQLTGGSDKEGFPMRRDVEGVARKRIILTGPPGYHPERKGQRKRKSVRGNVISEAIVQVNAKVVEAGKKTIEELWAIKPKEKEGKTKEQKAEAKGTGQEKADEKPVKKAEGAEKEPATSEKKAGKAQDQKESPEQPPEAKKAPESGQEKAEAKMGVKKLE